MAAPPAGSVTGLSDPWPHHSTHTRSREGRGRVPVSPSKPRFGDPSGCVRNCSLCWLSQGSLVGTSCSKLPALSGTAEAPGGPSVPRLLGRALLCGGRSVAAQRRPRGGRSGGPDLSGGCCGVVWKCFRNYFGSLSNSVYLVPAIGGENVGHKMLKDARAR